MNITFNSHKSTEDYYFDNCCILKYTGVWNRIYYSSNIT